MILRSLGSAAILGSSALVTIIVGLGSAKAYALLVGPGGLGNLAVFAGLVGFLGLVSGMGLGTGFVRLTGTAIKERETGTIVGNHAAMWLLYWALTTPVAVAVVVWRAPLAGRILGDPGAGWDIGILAPALMFSVASGLQMSQLSAFGKIGAVAKATASISVVGTALSIACVFVWRESGLAAAVLALNAGAWLVTSIATKSALSKEDLRGSVRALSEVMGNARALLAFGFPYTLSMVAGQGTQLLLPLLILANLDQEAVGYYRVAATLSTAYLGIVMIVLRNEYLPALSGVRQDVGEATRSTGQQLTITLSLSASMSVVLIVMSPVIVPLVYSSEFAPAVGIVTWYVFGDIIRIAALVVSYFVLVRSGSAWFLAIETTLGFALIVFTSVGIGLFGTVGIGVAQIAANSLHLLAALSISVAVSGFRPGATAFRPLVAFAAIGGGALAFVGLPPSGVRNLLIFVTVMATGLAALLTVRGWATSNRGKTEVG